MKTNKQTRGGWIVLHDGRPTVLNYSVDTRWGRLEQSDKAEEFSTLDSAERAIRRSDPDGEWMAVPIVR